MSPVTAPLSLVTAPMSPAVMNAVSSCFTGHVDQLAHPFLRTGAGVDRGELPGQFARNNFEIGELANKRVCDRFKDVGRKGSFVGAVDLDRLAVRVGRHLGSRFPCGRQMIHQRIEQHVNPLQGDCRTAEHRGDRTAMHTIMDAFDDLIPGERFARKIFFKEGFVGLGDRLADRGNQAFQTVLQIRHCNFRWLAFGIVLVCLIVNQVDITLDLVVLDDRHDDRADRRTEISFQLLEHLVEVRVVSIHLVDKKHLGFAEFFRELVRLLGAHRHARPRRNADQDVFRRAHALIKASGKIKKSGGVDQVDLDASPRERSDRTRDRYLAFDLLRVKITDRIPVIGFAQTVGRTGLEQQSLCQRGLSAPAVTGNRNVPDLTR